MIKPKVIIASIMFLNFVALTDCLARTYTYPCRVGNEVDLVNRIRLFYEDSYSVFLVSDKKLDYEPAKYLDRIFVIEKMWKGKVNMEEIIVSEYGLMTDSTNGKAVLFLDENNRQNYSLHCSSIPKDVNVTQILTELYGEPTNIDFIVTRSMPSFAYFISILAMLVMIMLVIKFVSYMNAQNRKTRRQSHN